MTTERRENRGRRRTIFFAVLLSVLVAPAGTALATSGGEGAALAVSMDGAPTDAGPLSIGTASATTMASVTYSSPSVSPTSLYRGSAVDASVTVTNSGASQATYNVSVSVDGTVRQWANGTIAASSTRQVTAEETLWNVGDRTVTVAGGSASATATVTVKNANPKYHHDARNTGNYPNQWGPTAEPVEAWNVTDGTPAVMQPTVVGDTLYFAFHNGGKLYAFDPETGTEKWNATPGGTDGSTWTTPAYANGVLYLGTNAHMLHAIDATNGNELWNYSTQMNVRSAPAVVDGVVYFGSNDGNLTAVNATSGEELWYYTEYQPVLVESNPAVVDGVVYFGSDANNVTALNATTGQKLWNFTTVDQVQSDPVVVNDTVYVGSDSTSSVTAGDGQLYALNATDGTKRWNYSMTGDVDGGPAYANGIVYAGSRGGNLTALNATTGQVIWSYTGPNAGFRGAPVVAGDVLYVMNYGNSTVQAFNASTGTKLWEYASPGGYLYATPLAWNGYLYYGSASHFYALEQPAPTISNVAATNPSGQDVQVRFDSDIQLVDIAVSISGAGTATLTEADFTESGSAGSYTYTATYAGASDGTYTATVDTAADSMGNDGASGESDSVTVDTTAPIADAGSDVSTDARVAVTLDASASSDAVGIASYAWDFGDGAAGDGVSPAHAYTSAGTYTVTLTLTDQSGNTDTDTVTVTVAPAWVSFGLGPSGNRAAPNGIGVDAPVSELWNVTTGGEVESSPAVVDGTVYVGSVDNNVYAFDATTGTERWRYTTGDRVTSSPAVVGDTVYVGSDDDTVYAIDATDGTERWTYTTGGTLWSSPAVLDGTVYVGSDDHNVYALNATDGTKRWNYSAGNIVRSSPTVVGDTVYVGSDDDTVYALNATDGTERWTYTTSYTVRSSPVVADGTVYVGNLDGNVYALNATDGTERWTYTTGSWVGTSPAVAGDTVYVGSADGNVYALNATDGSKRWKYTTGNVVDSSPAMVGDTVYVGSWDDTVYALNATDGTQRWGYATGGDVASSPAVVDGALYVGSRDYGVYALATQPTLSNVNVTNPSGQDVQISFDSDTRLSTISVSISGAESATLTESDFTESGSGPYTYTATYAGSSDGTYTVTLDHANDSAGHDGASGESGSVTIDVTPPAVSTYTVSNPAAQNVTVRLTTDERLATVEATVGGAESTTLTTSDFAEVKNGDGTYDYSTTYVGSTDGTYTVALAHANDSSNNDGAGGESGSVTIDTTGPTISGYAVSNPSGRNVRVSFESTRRLHTIAVTVDGPDPGRLWTSAFTRTDDGDGTYTYVATYAADTDGTYALTLDQAKGSSGTDVTRGETDSVVVDSSVPRIENLSLTNPEGNALEITVRSGEPLVDLSILIYGPNDTDPLLDALIGRFDEHRENGSVVYEMRMVAPETGTYEAVLVTAADAGGNDAAAGQTDTATVARPSSDTRPPAIDGFDATATGGDVRVTLDADEPLATIDVLVEDADGGRVTALNESAFTPIGTENDTYRYEASFSTNQSGSLTLTLSTAADAAGNDGASDESVTVTIDEADGSSGAVGRADGDDDGEISTDELGDAIVDWVHMEYTTSELQAIIRTWVAGG